MNFFKNPGVVIRLFIAVGYILLSVLLFITPIASETLSRNLKFAFCVLLFAYGVFRLYRAYQLFKEINNEQ